MSKTATICFKFKENLSEFRNDQKTETVGSKLRPLPEMRYVLNSKHVTDRLVKLVFLLIHSLLILFSVHMLPSFQLCFAKKKARTLQVSTEELENKNRVFENNGY